MTNMNLHIESISLPKEKYNNKLRSSIINALAWLEQNLLCNENYGHKIRKNISNGIFFTDETNQYLINSCLQWKNNIEKKRRLDYIKHTKNIVSTHIGASIGAGSLVDTPAPRINNNVDIRISLNKKHNSGTRATEDETIHNDSLYNHQKLSSSVRDKVTKYNNVIDNNNKDKNNTKSYRSDGLEKIIIKESARDFSNTQHNGTFDNNKTDEDEEQYWLEYLMMLKSLNIKIDRSQGYFVCVGNDEYEIFYPVVHKDHADYIPESLITQYFLD